MRSALANPNCDGLEFDVRGSREGVPILLHDETLDRVQGRPGRPVNLTLGELRAAGVPTLAELLDLAGRSPFLDIELKGEPVPAIVPVLEAARGPGLAHAVVSSFEAETLRWLHGERPAWPCWLNADELTTEAIDLARDVGCRGISVEWPSITQALVRKAKQAGLEVAAWTVRRRPTVARLERLGVVAICVEAAALDG